MRRLPMTIYAGKRGKQAGLAEQDKEKLLLWSGGGSAADQVRLGGRALHVVPVHYT